MTERVRCSVRDGVARIVLHRPDKGNAIDERMAVAMDEAVEGVIQDRSVRAILLTGAGKAFCVGGDVAMMSDAREDLASAVDRTLLPIAAAALKLARAPVPVVSALNGPVGGGGVGLALCADLVLAAESMVLRAGYSGIGLSPDLGVSHFLAHRAGAGRAKEILFLNRAITARECLAWGIVNAVHPDDRLQEEAESLVCQYLAPAATLALGRTKRLVDAAFGRSLEAHLGAERQSMLESTTTADAREGIAAFAARRPPRFRAR